MSQDSNESPQLSERELEIIRLVATGLSNKEIASQLYISVNTVKVHLRNIFGKLGIQSRTEATLYAVRQGWVSVDVARPEATEEAKTATAVPLAERPPLSAPPLPWPKRIALLVIVVLAVAGLIITWLRPASVGSAQTGEFDDLAGGITNGSKAGQSAWQVRAPMPTARGRLALAMVNGKLYAIGGITSAGITGNVEVYDPQTDEWDTLTSKPLPVANIAAAVLDSRIYVPGGYTVTGAQTAVMEVYDPASDTWLADAAPLPTPLSAYALVEYRHKLYLFGGSNGRNYVSASYVYDPPTNRWAPLAPMPTVRGFAAAAVLGDAIYVVGGYDGKRDYNVCERYWPLENRWETCPPLAVGRGGLGLVALGNELYAIGGGWKGYLAFGEQYTPERDKWIAVETPLTGQWRNLAAVVTPDSDIYAVGGWNGQAYLSANMLYQRFAIRIFIPFSTSP